MNTRLFLENFWATEQKNELFVCMPFYDSLDAKFGMVDKVAKELEFDRAIRTKENAVANDIVFEILDGITNSKTLLFDLSEDTKFAEFNVDKFSKINENVLYELGIAVTAREPTDILLISQKTGLVRPLPFDISTTRINFYQGELKEDWLKSKLDSVVKQQAWYLSRRIDATIRLIDSWALRVIQVFSKVDSDHFNDSIMSIEEKLGAQRLIDLGIVFFAHGKLGTEYAYYWTEFGKQVLRRMDIETVYERNKRLKK